MELSKQNKKRTEHTLPGDLAKRHHRAGPRALVVLVDGHIELQPRAGRLDAAKGHGLGGHAGLVGAAQHGRLVPLPRVPQGREDLDVEREPAPDALDAADEPALELLLDGLDLAEGVLAARPGLADGGERGLGPREEVDEVDDAVLVDVARLQDVGRGQVGLLDGAGEVLRRRDGEVPPLGLVEEAAEDAWGVEVGPFWGGGLVSRDSFVCTARLDRLLLTNT